MTQDQQDERPLPLWASLTMESSREEVLAAVEESERHLASTMKAVAEAEFPTMPTDPAKRRGCYASADGDMVACYRGPTLYERDAAAAITEQARVDEILLERQAAAGEEDQSAPGWDEGA